jgi:chemotaxis protein methyltransferase CheR
VKWRASSSSTFAAEAGVGARGSSRRSGLAVAVRGGRPAPVPAGLHASEASVIERKRAPSARKRREGGAGFTTPGYHAQNREGTVAADHRRPVRYPDGGRMTDSECVALLQATLPLLGLRWKGFKNVRRQVCRRITARMAALKLDDAATYRGRVEADPAEQRVLYELCHVTISRFYRDRSVYDALRSELLPALAERARATNVIRVWSAGCASGEEPYTVAILWRLELAARFPDVTLDVVATDLDEAVLARARIGAYEAGSLRELPESWRDAAFERRGNELVVREPFREGVTFMRADIRSFVPPRPLHVVLCRNAVFTYFAEPEQARFVDRVADLLVTGGLLVIGAHEALPAEATARPEEGRPARPSFEPCPDVPYVFRRVPGR